MKRKAMLRRQRCVKSGNFATFLRDCLLNNRNFATFVVCNSPEYEVH